MIHFVLLSPPRSGNHFIKRLLANTGKVRFVIRADITFEMRDKINIEKLKQLERGKPIGLLPVHPTHRNLSVMLPDLFRKQGYKPKFIWLVRRDKLEQATSWIRAKKTDVYLIHRHSTEEKRKLNQSEIDISKQDLHRHIASCFFGDQAVETFCIEHGITPYKIFYEDFLDETYLERNIAKLLDFLSIRYELPLSLNPSIEMQRTKSSTELYPDLIEWLNEQVSPEHLPFKL